MIKKSLVLAIDPGSNKCGIAYGHDRDDLTYYTKTFPKKKDSNASRFVEFKDWLNDLITEVQPDIIAYEGANPGLKGVARYIITNLDGLIAISACIHEVNCVKFSPSEIKKFITGRGNAPKADVIDSIERLGFHPEDDNDADALAIFCLAKLNVDNERI